MNGGTLLRLLTGIAFLGATYGCEKSPGGETAPIAFTPDAQVGLAQKTAELDSFIHAAMARDDIPGLSTALVRDGKVVWAKGYGVANSITRRAVYADTPFEGASLGKPVTTYAALTLVQEGRLDLHRPLRTYLNNHFVADSTWGNEITAWQVMTHTSGLSNDLLEKTHSVSFEPGLRFSYSGVGYMYLQHVIEAVTLEPFDEFVKRTVFEKLQMRSTSYYRSSGEPSMSRGHGYFLGFVVPWPYAPIDQPNAANLLCTTAPDLAKFAAELMNPTILSKSLVDQMLSPQEPAGGKVSWGLGIALYQTSDGRCFWHWGDNVDFESYLLGCANEKNGIVVMTNSSRGRLLTREIAAKALGSKRSRP